MNFRHSIELAIIEVRELITTDCLTFTRSDRIRDCLDGLTDIESLWIACNMVDAASLEQLVELRADIKISTADELESDGQDLLKECLCGQYRQSLMRLAGLQKYDAFACICLVASELGLGTIAAIRNLIKTLEDYQISLSA